MRQSEGLRVDFLFLLTHETQSITWSCSIGTRRFCENSLSKWVVGCPDGWLYLRGPGGALAVDQKNSGCRVILHPAVIGHRGFCRCQNVHLSSSQKPLRPYRQLISHQWTCRNSVASSAFFFSWASGPGPAGQRLSAGFQVPEKLPVTPRVITGPGTCMRCISGR